MGASEKILVVDDEPLLRENLRAFLEDIGFEVLEAAGGREAIEACVQRTPHLILLDISMPGLDGFEVCRLLKADPRTSDLPVIFLSALLSTDDKVKAFACGGVDYVTKPFQFEEVEARVRAHLEIQQQRAQLKEQHEALRRMEARRDSFTHMMAHDMRGPLTGIIASLELALDALPSGNDLLASHLERAQVGAERISSMITQMLDLSRLEAGSMPLHWSLCDVTRLAREASEPLQVLKGGRRMLFSGSEPVMARCDPGLVARVLENLLRNAWKFAPEDGSVEIQVGRSGNRVRVAVLDDGPGIPLEHRQSIFEKFSQAPGGSRDKGFGLGLAFCRLAVEAHQGEIGVESEPGQRCTFWFTLPSELQ